MNQQYIPAYLNLIQELLRCSDGEEWNVLHQHEQLLSPEFVEFMAQVAQKMMTNGKLEPAKFLYHWVEQLKHIYPPANYPNTNNNYPQAYLDLIQKLLDCPEGREADILTAYQDLVDSRLVHLLRQVVKQMLARGENETANYLNNLAIEINQLLAMQANVIKPNPENHRIEYPVNGHNPNHFYDIDDLIKSYQDNHENNPEFPSPNFLENIAGNSSNTSLPNQDTQAEKTVVPKLEEISTSLQAPSENQPNTFSQQHVEISLTSQLEEKLNNINQSLQKLEQILISRSQPVNPLWYMDILERAQACDWLLSSEEVELLIGVKPKCEVGKDTFQRGCWIFTKIGKMGSQTAWKISKY